MPNKSKNKIKSIGLHIFLSLFCIISFHPKGWALEGPFLEYDFIPWPWPKMKCTSQFLTYNWHLIDQEGGESSTILTLEYEPSKSPSRIPDAILLKERDNDGSIVKVGLSRINPEENLNPLKFLVLNFKTKTTEVYKIQMGAWKKKPSPYHTYSPEFYDGSDFNTFKDCHSRSIGLIVEQLDVDAVNGEPIRKLWGIRNVNSSTF